MVELLLKATTTIGSQDIPMVLRDVRHHIAAKYLRSTLVFHGSTSNTISKISSWINSLLISTTGVISKKKFSNRATDNDIFFNGTKRGPFPFLLAGRVSKNSFHIEKFLGPTVDWDFRLMSQSVIILQFT